MEAIECNGDSGCKINKRTSNGKPQSDHVVPSRIGKVSGSRESSLDPRAESFYSERIPRNGEANVRFEANYNIIRATKTTIMQTLLVNTRTSGSGRFFPGVFITVTKTFDRRRRPIIRLYRENPEGSNANLAPFQTIRGTSSFNLKVETNGSSATVYVNGSRKYSQSFSGNTDVQIRYGAYHHAVGERVNAGANIRVTDARLSYL